MDWQIETLTFIQYLLVFLLGAALTSFYNASIYRIENEIQFPGILTNASYCEGCKRKLKWYELIPILGYIYRRGVCPDCGYKVPLFYPVSEALFGFSMVLLFYMEVDLRFFILLNFLYFLALYDYEYKGFPRSIMHIFLIVTGAIFIYDFFFTFDREIIVLILSLSIIAIVALLNLMKKSFGTGDLLVILMISFIVPLNQFVAIIFFSIVIAGVFSIFLILGKRATKKDTIPFVPFIYLAYLLTFPLQPYISKYFASLLQLW